MTSLGQQLYSLQNKYRSVWCCIEYIYSFLHLIYWQIKYDSRFLCYSRTVVRFSITERPCFDWTFADHTLRQDICLWSFDLHTYAYTSYTSASAPPCTASSNWSILFTFNLFLFSSHLQLLPDLPLCTCLLLSSSSPLATALPLFYPFPLCLSALFSFGIGYAIPRCCGLASCLIFQLVPFFLFSSLCHPPRMYIPH